MQKINIYALFSISFPSKRKNESRDVTSKFLILITFELIVFSISYFISFLSLLIRKNYYKMIKQFCLFIII